MSSEVPRATSASPQPPIPPHQEQLVVELAANSAAPSGSNKPPVFAQPRSDTYDPPLSSHDPPGSNSLFSKSENFDLEAGQPSRHQGGFISWLSWLTRQIFSALQLWLPSIYSHRVETILRETGVTIADFPAPEPRNAIEAFEEIIKMTVAVGAPNIVSMKKFSKKWKAFVTQCMEEWNNLNLISILLMGTLVTFLQITEAGLHPATRLTTLLSLVCAFMSLLFSVWYLARFHSLKGVKRGMGWIFAAEPSRTTSPYWNKWLFLAVPAVWLAWSLLFFIASLLAFIWTSGDRRVPALTPFSDETSGFLPMSLKHFTPLWPRVILTGVFAIGFVMGCLVWQAFRDVGALTANSNSNRRGLDWLSEDER